jgi:uncharacterized protein YjaG (DUF416 family)
MSDDAETKTMLQQQGEKMREEMVKASDKVKEMPAVKKALEMYDEQMEKLKTAMDSEAAKKIFDMLTAAKDAFVKALEAAQASAIGQTVMQKINDAQAQAQAKIDELKAKAGGAKTAE